MKPYPTHLLATWLVLATSTASADEPAPQAVPLRPFVTCVETLSRARLRVHWGYLNTTRVLQVREIGAHNQMRGSTDGAPPKKLEPGMVVEAFTSVMEAVHPSTWSLDGVTATADASSHPCSPAQRSPSPDELVNPAPGSAMFLGANFWNIDWQGAQEYFVAQAHYTANENPWSPQLIRDLTPYRVLRFMDWNLTNDAVNPQSSWATRRPRDQAQSEPVAFEWQIDLCNRTLKDYWVNIPHTANAAYFTQLAQLLREQLDSRLRVYVEWSNEVWNGSFPQHEYAREHGSQLGLPGSDPAMAFQVQQSLRVFEAFAQVFGADNPRVVKVLAGQAAYSGPCRAQLAALADPKINPKHIKADVYAIAPYVQGETLAELRGPGLTEAKAWIAEQVTCAKRAGLPVVAYEGGQDSFSLGNAGCEQLQSDPGMRALYAALLDAMAAAGLRGPFVHYTHSGSCWGLKLHTSDSASESPKYQGLLDWFHRTQAAQSAR